MNQTKEILRYSPQRKREVIRYVSPTVKPSTQQIRVVKSTYMQPSIHHGEKSSFVREPSNPSVSPTVSFGVNNSGVKGLHSQKTIRLENGDIYEGEVSSKGQYHGQGKYTFTNQKLQYQGSFADGKQHGRGQLLKIKSQGSSIYNRSRSNLIERAILYDGEWKFGSKNGEGGYYYDIQNHYYQGSWLNDQRHGNFGKYVSPLGTYEGKWKNGKAHGEGCLTLKNNTIFKGIFQDNEFVQGVVTYPNFDQYCGKIKNGLRNDNNGKYIYRSPKGGPIKYIGGWRNGKKNDQKGQGELVYANGCSFKGTFKEGSFVDSLRSTWEWPDGTKFDGWFSRSKSSHNLKPYTFSGVLKDLNGFEHEVKDI